jgi:hypothetical protein
MLNRNAVLLFGLSGAILSAIIVIRNNTHEYRAEAICYGADKLIPCEDFKIISEIGILGSKTFFDSRLITIWRLPIAWEVQICTKYSDYSKINELIRFWPLETSKVAKRFGKVSSSIFFDKQDVYMEVQIETNSIYSKIRMRRYW